MFIFFLHFLELNFAWKLLNNRFGKSDGASKANLTTNHIIHGTKNSFSVHTHTHTLDHQFIVFAVNGVQVILYFLIKRKNWDILHANSFDHSKIRYFLSLNDNNNLLVDSYDLWVKVSKMLRLRVFLCECFLRNFCNGVRLNERSRKIKYLLSANYDDSCPRESISHQHKFTCKLQFLNGAHQFV